MNRTIKFRAWDGEAIREILALSFLNDEAVVRFPVKGSMKAIKGSQLTLMQFTGLLDKNGKEIYEGDVVNLGGDENFIIEWLQDDAKFWFKGLRGNRGIVASIAHRAEIIGNIYESPELTTPS